MRILKRTWIIVLILIAVTPSAQAYEGLHLLIGAGLNDAQYRSEGDIQYFGVGPSLKTEVAYYFPNQFALDLGSLIKFNHVEDKYTAWGTLLTLGARFELERWSNWAQRPYWRLLLGYDINVIYLKGDSPYNRLQLEGPMGGIGVGAFQQTESGLDWYWEWTFTIEGLEKVSLIDMDKDVPVVVGESTLKEKSRIYTMFVNFGIMAF